MTTQKALVTEILHSADHQVTFFRCRLETPEQFSFTAGQFVMIHTSHDDPQMGKPLKKPYSIGTTPARFALDGTVGFIVKKAAEGFMSAYLTDHLHIGDALFLDGPFGHMVDRGRHKKYLFVGIGSGLAPVLSIYEHIAPQAEKIAFLYGERFASTLIPSLIPFFAEQEEGASTHERKRLFLSQEHETQAPPVSYTTGHVQDGLTQALQFLGSTDISVFLCGKPAMVDSIKSLLIDASIDPATILFEKF